jgi:hypothetical protein
MGILKEVRLLKKVQRSPEKCDALSVFAAWAQRNRVAITQADAVQLFAESLQTSLKESLDSDTMLFGGRTQAMFEAVVANLGAVHLVKTEDNGDLYTTGQDIKIPDTRIVLSDGRNLLVEVKNNHQDPTKPFRVPLRSVEQWERYAQLVKADLRIAIYWSRAAVWSLVPLDAFSKQGKWSTIDVGTAFTRNDMGALGDLMIGCAFPIVWQSYIVKYDGRIHFDEAQTRIFAGSREIYGLPQKQLLRFMVVFGGWTMSEPKVLEESDTHRIVECVSTPDEENSSGLNGYVSSMLSRYWLQLTSTLDGDLATLLPSRDAWSDQILNVTNEGESVFAICRIKSSLDEPKEAVGDRSTSELEPDHA